MSDDLCWSRQYGAAKGGIERSRCGGILSVFSSLSCRVVREVEHSIPNDGYSHPRSGGVTCEEYSLPRGGGVTRGTSSSLDSGKATI